MSACTLNPPPPCHAARGHAVHRTFMWSKMSAAHCFMTARMVKVLPEPCEQGRKGGERHAACELQCVEMPHAVGVAGCMVMQGEIGG